MGFYEEMRDEVASPLLAEFRQGIVTLTRTVTALSDPSTPWIPGAATTTTYTLDATVAAVTVDQANAKYIDGTTITTADVVVTCAAFETTPQMTDTLSIDGKVRAIKKIVHLPAAGTPVAFKVFVEG